MIKRLLFISFLSLIFYVGYSQKSSITFSAGPSFPIGNYSAKNFDNDKAGFAAVGEQVSLSFDHKIGKYISFSAMLYGQRNGLNRKAMQKDLSQRKFYGNAIYAWSGEFNTTPPLPVTYTSYPDWKIDRSAWLMGSLLMGASAEIPLKPKGDLVFITKVLAGIIYVSSPRLYGESITDTAQAIAEQTSESAFGISFLVRPALKYNLTKKCFVTGGVDLFGTNQITFHDVKATFTTVKNNGSIRMVSQYSTIADGRQMISSINLHVGIGLRL